VQLGDDDRFSFGRRRGEVTRFSPDRGHPRPKRTYSIDCERCCHPMPCSRALVKNIERIRLIGVSGCKSDDAVINGSQMIMQAWILAFSMTVLYLVDSRKVRRCNAPDQKYRGITMDRGNPFKKGLHSASYKNLLSAERPNPPGEGLKKRDSYSM
jgi:hypothetical protein